MIWQFCCNIFAAGREKGAPLRLPQHANWDGCFIVLNCIARVSLRMRLQNGNLVLEQFFWAAGCCCKGISWDQEVWDYRCNNLKEFQKCVFYELSRKSWRNFRWRQHIQSIPTLRICIDSLLRENVSKENAIMDLIIAMHNLFHTFIIFFDVCSGKLCQGMRNMISQNKRNFVMARDNSITLRLYFSCTPRHPVQNCAHLNGPCIKSLP